MSLRKSKISVLRSFSPKPMAKDNLAEFCAPGTTYFERMIDVSRSVSLRVVSCLGLKEQGYVLCGTSLSATAMVDCYNDFKSYPFCMVLLEPNAIFNYPKWSLFINRVNTKEDYEMYEINCRALDAADPYKLRDVVLAISSYQIWDRLDSVKSPNLIVYASRDTFHRHDDITRMISMLKKSTRCDLETHERIHSREFVERMRNYIRENQTCYHGYSLPRSMSSLFSSLSFKDSDEIIKDEWKHVYLTVLKKATLIMKGKRLILKNPLNTNRIPVLLEMFPNAKFIYLYRNPYMIYYSLLHTFSRLIGAYQLEKISKSEIEENVFNFYEGLMRRYWDTKELIPSGNLVEVRFEDFEDHPMEVIEKIYAELNLPAFEENRDNFEKHIFSQEGYKKNKYRADRETINRISQRWRFAIERLKYSPPSGLLKIC